MSEFKVISQNSWFVNSRGNLSHTSLNKTKSLGPQNGRGSRGKPQSWLDPKFRMVVS